MNSTHDPAPDDEATRMAQEQLAWLRFMKQVLTPLPPEDLYQGGNDALSH